MIAAITVTRWGARYRGVTLACAVGRGGLTNAKKEGDNATPLGTHHIVGMLFRPDRIPAAALPSWARPIGPRDLWSDDPADPAYNHLVHAPHAGSHEALRRPDPLYDLVLVTDWNYPAATPGRGSAIFVHRWRKPRHPTAGCVAFAPRDLLWLARTVEPGTPLIVKG